MYKDRTAYFVMVIVLTLICACGGGGGGGDDGNNPPSGNQDYPTGNQDFTIEDGLQADVLTGFRMNEGDSNTVPQRIDHSSAMPRVRSQGRTGSCTAWAVGYYGKSFQEAKEMGWDADQNAFSPAYLYAMQCRTYQRPWSVIRAIEVLQHDGIAKWDTLPFEDLSKDNDLAKEKENYANMNISQEAHDEAKIFRCGEASNLKRLADIKNALTQGPIVLAINRYDLPPLNPSPEENYMRPNENKTNVGHAILCVGYDNDKFGNGALKFINSWGTQWGENGYSWIRYADLPKIMVYAGRYKDLPNPAQPDGPGDVNHRPEPPTDVAASDDAGSFVDVSWSRVSGAQYYRIYRCEVDDHRTYAEIGISYRSNYRDYPAPGVDYYYSVIAVNDLGESEHYPSDTDAQGHVDIGSAAGDALTVPVLNWEYNDSDGSHFSVDDVDPAATSMEVLISTTSAGPWDSLGWIKPDDFFISWGDDSEYTNKKPYVRVRVANADAYSEPCDPVQVGDNIDENVDVGRINVYIITPKIDSILLRWMTDGGNIDFFEIWRYNASSDTANEWIKIGYSTPSVVDENNFIYFEDTTPLPGVPYYYVVVPVYRGTYGQLTYSDDPVKVQDSGVNLKIKYFSYYYTQISSPTEFPEVIVRNDGSSRVDSYTIGILAYDWSDRQSYVIDTLRVDTPLEPGSQHTLRLVSIPIPEAYADGHVYSWGIRVDQEQEFDETYEDDNTLWSSDGWWLASKSAANDMFGADGKMMGPRLGDTLPFSDPPVPGELPERQAVTGDPGSEKQPLMLYNGPSLHHRPDFCNNHAK
jgi:hypothetical protein